MSNVVYVGFEEEGDKGRDGGREEREVRGEYRMAWLWVEGWRARLRGGGDVVERGRWGEGDGIKRGVVVRGNHIRR